MAKDYSRQMYEDEAEKRGNYFFDIYERRKSVSPWYLKWYDQKHIDRKDWIQEARQKYFLIFSNTRKGERDYFGGIKRRGLRCGM